MRKSFYSADEKYKVSFQLAGVTELGPSYFTAKINEIEIQARVFSDKVFFSKDSKYIALEEWLDPNFESAPDSRLILIDAITMKLAIFKTIHRGLIGDVQFKTLSIRYERIVEGEERILESEVEFAEIRNWIDIIQ